MADSYQTLLRRIASISGLKAEVEKVLRELSARVAGVSPVEQFKVGTTTFITSEGGFATLLRNYSESVIPHGTALNYDEDNDFAVVVADGTTTGNQFVVIGWAYGDIPAADGGTPGEGWVVRRGTCECLLEDGYASQPNSWMRLSPITPGRMMVFNRPGLDIIPASVAYTFGSTLSGTLPNLLTDNGNYFQIAEQAGAADGIDCYFAITPAQTMESVVFNGHYAGSGGHNVVIELWDWTAGGGAGAWESTGVTLNNAAADVSHTITLADKHMKADTTDEIRVRFFHAVTGVEGHILYIDKLVAFNSSNTEHFKECGHGMAVAATGTDVLATFDIHLL